MSHYLLDTNICIHFLKGEAQLLEKLDAVSIPTCYISELTIAELTYGVARSAPTRQAANRQNLVKIQQLFAGRTLPIADCFELYGSEKARLRSIGRPVDDFDLLIGCTALAHGLTLATRNTRHFAELQGIRLENWIDDISEIAAPGNV
ncbi:type II toxin-antitoxin system VapC family toxin [Hymenobacter psychrotolerans]|uniref:Ribonuclease VapC n=1 Tax=Hymenobacter psychrotolerans DSM 18569 TaxID=1121959 RepID=A0A1M6YGN2_9BACT|nr:type II toxin-antitoxin system VapC family toxin [Hymenobacter psychrotolerans]SHL17446.1 tRNA(fMet)-specific endonuclease VapC [Hymenobacter psychrotolerans DSM 18569]